MKKHVFGRQLKRTANQRKALFKGLLTQLILHEKIKTTQAKAKAIKSDADKLITRAKKGGEHSSKILQTKLPYEAVKKLLEDLAPRFTNRHGGYTRIQKIKNRTKDNASMVQMEWSEASTKLQLIEPKKEIKNEKSI